MAAIIFKFPEFTRILNNTNSTELSNKSHNNELQQLLGTNIKPSIIIQFPKYPLVLINAQKSKTSLQSYNVEQLGLLNEAILKIKQENGNFQSKHFPTIVNMIIELCFLPDEVAIFFPHTEEGFLKK
jgi:hypothetical protein